MTVSLSLFRNNEELAISGGDPYWFVAMTGLGLGPIVRQKERSPQQHGSTDAGFLLNDRLLNLVLLIETSSRSAADTARDNLLDFLKPVEDTDLQLRVTRDDGEIRQIDCNVNGIVDIPNDRQNRIGNSQTIIIQLDCPNPFPYEPTLQNLIFDTSSGGGYQVPITVPILYTTGATIDKTEIVQYDGKWEEAPIIYITGPATDLVITNETTGYVLDFTGHTIAGGDTYTVNLQTRRIVDQNGVRKLSALTDDSNLLTWRLAADPIAPDGVNSIHVEVPSGATVATRVRIEYYNRYAWI